MLPLKDMQSIKPSSTALGRRTRSGLIEAGGDIRYWGEKPDGHLWRFGIQHPRDPNRYFEVEDIGLAAIATSGDYQQYFSEEGSAITTYSIHRVDGPRVG